MESVRGIKLLEAKAGIRNLLSSARRSSYVDCTQGRYRASQQQDIREQDRVVSKVVEHMASLQEAGGDALLIDVEAAALRSKTISAKKAYR